MAKRFVFVFGIVLAAALVLIVGLNVAADVSTPAVGIYPCGDTTPYLTGPNVQVAPMISTTLDGLDVYVLPQGWASCQTAIESTGKDLATFVRRGGRFVAFDPQETVDHFKAANIPGLVDFRTGVVTDTSVVISDTLLVQGLTVADFAAPTTYVTGVTKDWTRHVWGSDTKTPLLFSRSYYSGERIVYLGNVAHTSQNVLRALYAFTKPVATPTPTGTVKTPTPQPSPTPGPTPTPGTYKLWMPYVAPRFSN